MFSIDYAVSVSEKVLLKNILMFLFFDLVCLVSMEGANNVKTSLSRPNYYGFMS